uniref:Reverse transcriptase Ty1/copia-type domain-containing protein n=1 Tax=Arundo donax TaxID=35708 RepID=A0A0A9CLG3_ARUDO
MTKRFKMSMMGELKFFLAFQVKQLKEGIFLCQTKYINDMLIWRMTSLSRHPCKLMGILISMRMARSLIKRYIVQ